MDEHETGTTIGARFICSTVASRLPLGHVSEELLQQHLTFGPSQSP